MKLFVATESLGEEDDFSFTIPGELVHLPPVICDCPECGCERAMAGFTSRKASTCFVVRDLDIDPATYVELLFEALGEGGWVREGSADDRKWVKGWAGEHMDMAAGFPTETPLQVDRDQVTIRRVDQAIT